ncbi:hypothetical protein [Cupriavidus oxalaticus]|uniref:hypothetical protein n=1 Tax=Cupriavidus oxalaticus TaxID=96344 RepID=UPI00316E38C7
MTSKLDSDTRLLAAVAYGEASSANDAQEIGGIAFAVANRCRAWHGKAVSQLRAADPNYAYAWDGSNARFNKLMQASDRQLEGEPGMKLAVEWARKAWANEGDDPSRGAFWWDGLDFKTNPRHRKIQDGFKWGSPAHNIFGVAEHRRDIVVRWRIVDRRTGKVEGSERGRYDSVWISTSAHGSTIFWQHNPDYLKATGGKAYR